jgi:hypothetical protein
MMTPVNAMATAQPVQRPLETMETEALAITNSQTFRVLPAIALRFCRNGRRTFAPNVV